MDESKDAPEAASPNEDRREDRRTVPGAESSPSDPTDSAGSEARELFATFLSHEIRQPLGSLGLWLDLLESTLGIDLGIKGQEYMDRIHEEVDRIAEMVDEQMIFSEVAALKLQREWMELTEVLEEVRRDLQPAFSRIQAELRVGPLPRICSDPRLLHPLMRNLLANAVQYRSADRPLVIEVTSRDPEPASDMACEVVVEDNGRGFAQEDHERMFRLFERLDPDGPPGTGIGLALCRRIAERLGGRLTAESRPGEGAVFILGLPDQGVEEGDGPR